MYVSISHVCVHTPAPCLSNGVTDCSQCDSNEGCQPLSSASCLCSPDCFTHGNCCPDIVHIPSCLGMYQHDITQHFKAILMSSHGLLYY